ncbi:MAG: S26 family signal peptidase [Candidatus Thermoplasmatota archaeon]
MSVYFFGFIRKTKKLFLRFWKTENEKVALLRDVIVALFLVSIIITSLWAYTGQWFGTPMVAIESGSMEHDPPSHSELPPFGRIGTIDAGDMVLLMDINGKNDIVPRGSSMHGALAQRNRDVRQYDGYGDVIIYHPNGYMDADQIIHRVICWVEKHENGTYSVEAYGIHYANSIDIGELGLKNYKPDHSGFITKGDANEVADQYSPDNNGILGLSSSICRQPVKVSWISGKARGEIPWLGTLNLFFNDLTSGTLGTPQSTVVNVPSDSITCLVLLIAALISIPVSLDIYDYLKKKE